MKNKTILGLLLGVSMWGVTANAQSAITWQNRSFRGGPPRRAAYSCGHSTIL
jgi:hypothetical protein